MIKPNLVFSKGGSGSLVTCLASKLLNIPIFIHESDSVPGLSNKKIYKFAKKVFTSFEETEYFNSKNTILVGNPIRSELLNIEDIEAKKTLDITKEKPIIFFLGGSQGAEAINQFVLSNINKFLESYEIIHMAGKKNYENIKKESEILVNKNNKKYYHLYKSLNELELKSALKLCEIVVSRAGSGSIFEIALFGKPSILIPLPTSAQNHQFKNAYQYAETRAGIVMEQKNLTLNLFLAKINNLLSEQKVLEKMKESALNFAKPEAGQKIAKEILKFIQG
jgi:UDP-N-acetylglucosamine--N-acetylmuramyl-(pentapeptide) pyrophosphoryl-undecaprenol N-acetylglucosamine transferase